MTRYIYTQGMLVKSDSGDYVLYSDHLAEMEEPPLRRKKRLWSGHFAAQQATLAEKDREYQTLLSHHEEQMGDSMGKITCLKTTFEEKEREVIKAQRKWSIAMERIAALQAAMEHGCDESNCPMWTNLKNYEKEVDIANDRIKELEDANEMFADLLLKDGTRIQSLKLRNRELTEALEKIATSDEPISDFTQFDEADIRSSTMHMAREIAKQALGGGEK